jgi:hypothetical protein
MTSVEPAAPGTGHETGRSPAGVAPLPRRRVRALVHVMRAELLDRVRRHGYLVTLGITLYFAYTFLPPLGAPYVTLQIAGHRGVYDSAWVGCAVAMLASGFLSLAGFYLVRDAIERDRRTGVGPILASTPLEKPLYTLGKAASNFAVLASIVLLLAIGAMGMQVLRAESLRLDPMAVLVPFVVVTLPAMSVVAGLAVLFEATPGLRGGLGNVVYLIVWCTLLATGATQWNRTASGIGDFGGTAAVMPQMIDATARAFPGAHASALQTSLGLSFGDRTLTTFHWAGPVWSASILAGRLAWTLIGFGLALLAAIPFDRFDTARGAARRAERADVGSAAGAITATHRSAASIGEPMRRTNAFAGLVVQELRLLAKGQPWPWWVVMAGLTVAVWLAPMPIAGGWLLPLAWVWPLLVWSPMGARDALHGTTPLMASSRSGVTRVAATWLAGFTISALAGLGVLARHTASGDAHAMVGWLVGAAFPPSLALAAGLWTGNGRLFEVLYLLLWYIGPMNHLDRLDFVGTDPRRIGHGASAIFGAISLALLGLSILGQARTDPYARLHFRRR